MRRRLSFAMLIVFGLFSAGMSWRGLAASLTSTATPTPTRTSIFPRLPTFSPVRTATPTTPSLIVNLRTQLFWGGAGGGFSDPGMSQFECFRDLVIPKTTPAIIPIPRKADDFGGLCLVGFTLGKPLTIQFTSPDRSATITGVFRRGEQITTEQDYLIEQVQPDIGDLAAGSWSLNPQGIPIALIITWMPLGLAEGSWTVEARNGEQTARTVLDTTWPKGAARLGWRYPQASILGRPPTVNIYARTGCNSIRMGETIPIFGSGFKPFSTVPIGLYAVATGSELRSQISATADRTGNLLLNFKADPLQPPGDYAIVAGLNTNTNQMDETGPIACVKKLEWKPCPDAPVSRISPFFGVRTNPADPGANNIRSQPGLASQILGKTSQGESIYLMEGPRCADKMVWWKVETENKIEGWVSEGQGEKIFLLPGS